MITGNPPSQAVSKRGWDKVLNPFLTELRADLGAQKAIYVWWWGGEVFSK